MDMVPESVVSELTLSHPTVAIQSNTGTTHNNPDSPPRISAPLSQNPILLEPKQRYLERKRKHNATLVPTHELNRRTRINGNERTIQERRQELRKIFKAVDANYSRGQAKKKQKLDGPVGKLGALTYTQVSREIVMRTEVVPMLPFKGYTLPRGTVGNVVYIGGRERIEGLPWMSVVDIINVYGKEPKSDENEFGGDESEAKFEEAELEDGMSVVGIVGGGGDFETEGSLVHEIYA